MAIEKMLHRSLDRRSAATMLSSVSLTPDA
jgi:hypothetical protein